MRVLIACEFSGTVRDAFRSRGHDAWSCDLIPDLHDSPHHLMMDAAAAIRGGMLIADDSPDPLWLPIIAAEWQENGDQIDARDPITGDWDCYPTDCATMVERWDLVVAHPPCTYLASSGLHWNRRKPGRQARTDSAAAFFMALVHACEAHADRWAIENSIGCMSRLWRKPDQIIHPHQFGHDASKATCLWLAGLPRLAPTCHVMPRMVDGRPRWANQQDSGQSNLGETLARPSLRSLTFAGIAGAMADQWGGIAPA